MLDLSSSTLSTLGEKLLPIVGETMDEYIADTDAEAIQSEVGAYRLETEAEKSALTEAQNEKNQN